MKVRRAPLGLASGLALAVRPAESAEEKPQLQSHPKPGGRRPGHRANSARPLASGGPHGCENNHFRVVIDGETAAVVPRTTTSEIHRYKANATHKRTQARPAPEGQ